MPLCRFPEQARYKGSGDVTDASSWSCPQQDQSLLAVGPNGIQAGLDAAHARVHIAEKLPSKGGN
jgi:feruloyl esterase